MAALQEGKYDAARDGLAKLRENAKEREDTGVLWAFARRCRAARRPRRCRASDVEAAAADSRSGRWIPKIRFELAAIELAAGNLAVAEELARSEAIRLLADDRKDRLAEVYHAFARKLLEPDDP